MRLKLEIMVEADFAVARTGKICEYANGSTALIARRTESCFIGRGVRFPVACFLSRRVSSQRSVSSAIAPYLEDRSPNASASSFRSDSRSPCPLQLPISPLRSLGREHIERKQSGCERSKVGCCATITKGLTKQSKWAQCSVGMYGDIPIS